MSSVVKATRRGFLKTAAGAAGGLLLGVRLPAETVAAPLRLNAWVHIAPDDLVTLFIHKAEMGQGTVTSLSMLLAEELECDWNKIRTQFPGIDSAYGNYQGVVGSASVRTSWEPLRRAGATAREMLIEAAAKNWGVDRSQCRAANGAVVSGGRRLSYGALADAAAKLPVPSNVVLKKPDEFAVIGKPRKRLDTPDKTNGRATFGIDVRLPGMLHAVVARCPVFGGKVARFSEATAKTVPGVKSVVQISSGIAVVADNTWSAAEGRRVLDVQWDNGPRSGVNSAGISAAFAEHLGKPGEVQARNGDAAAALGSAAKKVEATYEVPYLAHAPMEPLNCTADVRPGHCEVWASTQGQTAALNEAVRITGLKPDQVVVHTLYMGGGFGRRARADYIGEAVEVSKAIGAPVQLTWTREDDMQQDWYRPASSTHFTAALDGDGWPAVLTGRVACPYFGGPRTAVEGIANMPYAFPHFMVDSHNVDLGIPVSYWRSVGYSQNVFFTESFIEEMALAVGKDPLDLRRRLLAKMPRMVAALDLAAGKAGWGKPLPAGHGRGIGLSNNVGSFTAQVAEVSVAQGKLRVHRVVCAVDCGQAINPAGVEQQIQSGIVFGLSAALKGAITIDQGRVQQGNFHQYDVLRIDEMPVVEVHLVPSHEAPGGMGEAATPGIAAAVANAVFAATGKRIRRLPIRTEDLA